MANYSIILWISFLLLLIQPNLSQEMSNDFEIISVGNARHLQEISQLGYGWLHKALWHPDNQRLFVAGSNALVVYSVNDWAHPSVIQVADPPLVNIAISEGGSRIALAHEGSITVIGTEVYEQSYQVEAQTFRSSVLESHVQFTESFLIALIVDNQYDYALRVWNIDTGELVDTIPYSQELEPTRFDPPDWPVNDEIVSVFLETQSHHLASGSCFSLKDPIEVDNVQ